MGKEFTIIELNILETKTIAECAALFQKSTSTIQRWRKDNKIKGKNGRPIKKEK